VEVFVMIKNYMDVNLVLVVDALKIKAIKSYESFLKKVKKGY
jgi:hypothetical protein